MRHISLGALLGFALLCSIPAFAQQGVQVQSSLTPNPGKNTVTATCTTTMDSTTQGAGYPGVSAVCGVTAVLPGQPNLTAVCPDAQTTYEDEGDPKSTCTWDVPYVPGGYYRLDSQHFVAFIPEQNDDGSTTYDDPLGFSEEETFTCDDECYIDYSGDEEEIDNYTGWEIATTMTELQLLSVSPTVAQVYPDGTQVFTASPNLSDIGWCLSLQSSGCTNSSDIGTQGTLDVSSNGQSATFDAPSTITPSYGGEYVCAQDNQNAAVYACANLMVTNLDVQITPSSVVMAPGQTQAFTAAVSGATQTINYSWSTSPSAGSGTTSGNGSSTYTYTAPSGVTTPITITAQGTAEGGPSGNGTATVSFVQPGTATQITSSAPSAAANYGNIFVLSANLSTIPSGYKGGSAVAWSYSGATNIVTCNGVSGVPSGNYFVNPCFFSGGSTTNTTFTATACIYLNGLKNPLCSTTNVPITPSTNGLTVGQGYQLRNQSSNGLCVDNTGFSNANGTVAQLYTCNDLSSQSWSFVSRGGSYAIQNQISGLCLENAGNSTSSGSPVTLSACNTNDAGQAWNVTDLQDGSFYITAGSSSQLYLSSPSATSAAGTQLQIQSGNGQTTQKWQLNPGQWSGFIGDDNAFIMENDADTKLCLDNTNGSTTSGTAVQLYTCNGLTLQHWVLHYYPLGYYSIENQATGLCLTDPGASLTPGTHIDLTTCNSSSSQLWLPVVTAGTEGSLGTFQTTWRNQASGLLLDNPSGSNTPGTFVQQYTPNGLSPQEWIVIFQSNQ